MSLGSTYTLYKKVAGSYTTLGSYGTVALGDVVKLVCSGSSISVVVNGVTLGTVTDSFNQTATGFGFRQGNGAAGSFSSFSVL